MTGPTVQQIQHDVNTRIAAFGEELANEIAPEMAARVKTAIAELEDNAHDPLWEDVLAPALAWHTLLHIANHVEKQSLGWADVFFQNLHARYLKERP